MNLEVKYPSQRAGSIVRKIGKSSGTDIKTVGKRLGHTQLATTNRYVHALRDADEAAAQSFATILQAPVTPKEETVGKA